MVKLIVDLGTFRTMRQKLKTDGNERSRKAASIGIHGMLQCCFPSDVIQAHQFIQIGVEMCF